MLLRSIVSIGLLAALLGTAACSSSSSSESKSASGEAQSSPTKVESTLGGLPPEVEVKVDKLPPGHEVERVVLVDPLGNEVEAEELSTPPRGRGARVSGGSRSVGFGIGGGSGGLRVGPSISLGVPLGRSGGNPRGGGSATAKIPVPDPDAYFAESDEWTVVVYARDEDGNPYSYRVAAPEFPGDRKVETITPGGAGGGGTGTGF